MEKECDKDANEIIGRRIQFSEIILISISEMIERMVANKETKKKAEEEKNKENEKGSIPLHLWRVLGLALIFNWTILICKT